MESRCTLASLDSQKFLTPLVFRGPRSIERSRPAGFRARSRLESPPSAGSRVTSESGSLRASAQSLNRNNLASAIRLASPPDKASGIQRLSHDPILDYKQASVIPRSCSFLHTPKNWRLSASIRHGCRSRQFYSKKRATMGRMGDWAMEVAQQRASKRKRRRNGEPRENVPAAVRDQRVDEEITACLKHGMTQEDASTRMLQWNADQPSPMKIGLLKRRIYEIYLNAKGRKEASK